MSTDTGITAADIENYAAIIRSEMADLGGQRAMSRRAAERIVSLVLAAGNGQPPAITKGDTIRIIPDKGPERVMVVSHVEHHVITLSDPKENER